MPDDKPKSDFSKIGHSNVNRAKSQERQIAKLLSAWTGEEFRRRRVTGRDNATIAVDLCADVIPVNGPFLFSVEAKTGKDFSFMSLVTSPKTSLFATWWHQTCYDAQLISTSLKRTLYPMLFFRPTPQTTWIGVSARVFPLLKPFVDVPQQQVLNSACWFPHLYFDAFEWLGPVAGDVSHGRPKKGKPRTKKIVNVALDPVVICPWKDFAANVDPSSAVV